MGGCRRVLFPHGETMFFERPQKYKRKPSLHQVQMRNWAIGLIVGAVVLFAAAFYLINKHYTQPGP